MAYNGTVDQDGDVEMKSAQPVFEYIKPPRLTDLGQPAVVKFVRDQPRILEHLAHYEFRTTLEEVTEARLQEDIKRRAGTLMNDHVPGVARLFSNSLKMGMKVVDIHARVVKYFMDFDQLVDGHGRQRMKTRCKLLISNLFPTVLRVDIERLVAVTYQHAKVDDVALYALIVCRAKYQQHFHTIQNQLKHDDPPKGKTATSTKSGSKKQQQIKIVGKADRYKSEPKAISSPPRTGCLVCKGPHWVKGCPDASEEKKQEIQRELQARRARKEERVKTGRTVRAGEGRRVSMNGVLDVPIWPRHRGRQQYHSACAG
eukprot:jgi/Phyca11/127636/e_gw1.71.70.1